jgi:hypothetical protein
MSRLVQPPSGPAAAHVRQDREKSNAPPVAATVPKVQRRGLSNVEPKQQIILTSTRSRHLSAG